MSGPTLLLWIEQNQRVLITGNRRTIPNHFRDHLASGHHVPGILVLTRQLSLGAAIEQLHLIWSASAAEEYRDLLLYLPL